MNVVPSAFERDLGTVQSGGWINSVYQSCFRIISCDQYHVT